MSATPRPDCYSNLEYLGAASAYTEDVYDAISKGPLFGQFAYNEIEALCKFLHCFAAPRGVTLLAEGDEGDYVIVILSGEVEVSKLNHDGVRISLATVFPGASLGEMSLVDGKERFASCVTACPTDFAVMTRANLNEFLAAYPWLANKLLIRLMQIMADRMRTTGSLFVENNHCLASSTLDLPS